MTGQRADARKRDEAISEGQVAAAAPLLLLDDVRRALDKVFAGVTADEASCVMDAFEDTDLRVVRT